MFLNGPDPAARKIPKNLPLKGLISGHENSVTSSISYCLLRWEWVLHFSLFRFFKALPQSCSQRGCQKLAEENEGSVGHKVHGHLWRIKCMTSSHYENSYTVCRSCSNLMSPMARHTSNIFQSSLVSCPFTPPPNKLETDRNRKTSRSIHCFLPCLWATRLKSKPHKKGRWEPPCALANRSGRPVSL